jgi:predicted lipid-binding transport protein (Tim44 family)
MKHVFLAILLALALALSPEAFAKAGSSKSMGSRGSRTQDRPIERSMTPQPAPQPAYQQPVRPPMAAAPPMAPMPAAQPSFFQRHPFAAGLMGGVVGAGIGSMLFGHSSAMAGYSEMSPVGSLLGTLFQFAMIGGLIWLGVRLFRRSSAPSLPQDHAAYRVVDAAPAHAPRVDKEFEPGDADKQKFAEILVGIQRGWSEGDLGSLKRLATPEMVSFLADDLAANVSRNARNIVEDVALVKGDVSEAWSENGKDYATAVLTFSSRDYTVRADNGVVVEGDPRAVVQSTEAWTFVRAHGGGWLLSAVERE